MYRSITAPLGEMQSASSSSSLRPAVAASRQGPPPPAKRRRAPSTAAIAAISDAPLHIAPERVSLDLGPAAVPGSDADTERRRRETIASECISAALADSTKRRYESVLRLSIGGSMVALDAALLPVDSDSKLMAIFADMVGTPWATICSNRAALKAWHVAEGLDAEFTASWTDRAGRFWAGLKRKADHTNVRAKLPLSSDLLRLFLDSRLSAPTIAGNRDAAIAAVCFFGVRRTSEALALSRADVTVLEGHIALRIRTQKNDPNAKGMSCHIPKLDTWGPRCPYKLVGAWVRIWDKSWGPHLADAPLFFLARKNPPSQVTYDTFRKVLKNALPTDAVGTHSLRKGGAWWYKHAATTPSEVVQAQGGWKSKQAMERSYIACTNTQRRNKLLSHAASAPAP